MNKQRRSELSKAVELLEKAKEIIEACQEEEQDAFDNLPESIQGSERGEDMEHYIYEMEQTIDYIDQAIDEIQDEVIDA